ncbi:MAG: hypothetical protein QM775_36095 [Pirellulales bacterium]
MPVMLLDVVERSGLKWALILGGGTAAAFAVSWWLRDGALRHARTGGNDATARNGAYRIFAFSLGAMEGLFWGGLLGLGAGRYFGWFAGVVAFIVIFLLASVGNVIEADKEVAESIREEDTAGTEESRIP